MKKLVFAIVALFAFTATYAQTIDDLKAEQGVKKDSIAAIQARVDALQGQIDAFPGWKKGAFGTIGANLSSFNNWYGQGTPNNSAGNIGITLNGFANLDREKYFWKNGLNVNLQWVKNDDKDNPNPETDGFNGIADVFNISSLFGYKLSEKFAISALGEYRTSILDSRFNNPGYLDFGIGVTWLPIEGMTVVAHPLNYNFVFADDDSTFESSTGAKIVVDYTRQFGGLNFKSNFSTFQSYKSGDLSNWTWINSLGYTIWKGIGLGLEAGLRGNKQETFAFGDTNAGPTLAETDVNTQSYWLFGLNYAF